MTIHKLTAKRCIDSGWGYEVTVRDCAQAICHTTALAIYTYLLSKPPDWIIREAEILDHFQDLGRDRYRAGMRYLKSKGYIWKRPIVAEGGRMNGSTLELFAHPEMNPSQQISASSVSNRQDSEPSEHTTYRKADDLHRPRLSTETEIIKNVKSKSSQSTRDRPIELDLTDTSWAEGLLLNTPEAD